jgi:pyruvate/2-oxoglutarate dehydrogenase complex dihydrolipoamide acyltransferase (E2) component
MPNVYTGSEYLNPLKPQKGTITRWFKNNGDRVDKNEPLFEFQSDNSTELIRILSDEKGFLAFNFPINENIKFGDIVAILTTKVEDSDKDNGVELYNKLITNKRRFITTSTKITNFDGYVVKMPNINFVTGDGLNPFKSQKVTIQKWYKNNGDKVEQNDLLFEFVWIDSNDKSVVQVFSDAEGYLAFNLPDNSIVMFGEILAVLTEKKEDATKEEGEELYKLLLEKLPKKTKSFSEKVSSTPKSSSSSEKKPEVPVPNQLNITIQTNIPGYQKIYFKPSMLKSISDKSDDAVQFNPLVKLDKEKIDKVPDNLRKKEFFDKGLFQSLMYFLNTTPVQNLTIAKRYGYIDHNIRLTLQTIFDNGTIIVIGGKPYTIADVRWTTGDWKVDTKQKKLELDPNRIRDPYLYSKLVKENLATGEEQLRNLEENSPDVVYGSSFTGQKNIIAPAPNTSVANTSVANTIVNATGTPNTGTNTIATSAKIAPVTAEEKAMKIEEEKIAKVKSANLKTDCDQDVNVKLTPIKQLSIPLRNYFGNREWMYLLNRIYVGTEEVQNVVNNLLKNSTDIDIQGGRQISMSAYNQLVSGVQVNSNSGGGDCFFIAVAQAINYYNCTNPENPILKNSPNQIFNQRDIRRVVLEYFTQKMSDPSYRDSLLSVQIPAAIDQLNKQMLSVLSNIDLDELNIMPEPEYEDLLNSTLTSIPEDQYVRIANEIYANGANEYTFLVQPPQTKPADPTKPFNPIEEKNYETYFLRSNYWGDLTAYQALITILQINVIIIKKNDSNDLVSIGAAGTFVTSEMNDWDKYLFLYHSAGHFELLSFTMKFKSQGKRDNTLKRLENKVSIFKRNNIIMPPVFIIFLIFFSNYLQNSLENQSQYSVFPDEMIEFKQSYDYLYQVAVQQKKSGSIDPNISDFYNKLSQLFPDNRKFMKDSSNFRSTAAPRQPRTSTIVPFQTKTRSQANLQSGQKGGYPPYYPSYYPSSYRSSYYGRPDLVSQMVKSADQYDPSKLAFNITISLELYPGENVPKEKLATLKCNSRWEDVRKAWSEFTGKPYVIIPKYKILQSQNNDTKRNVPYKKNNERQSYYPNTRRARGYYGGKK